jgi:hypothetical protein
MKWISNYKGVGEAIKATLVSSFFLEADLLLDDCFPTGAASF